MALMNKMRHPKHRRGSPFIARPFHHDALAPGSLLTNEKGYP